MASTTKTFLKSRAAESAAIKPGQWHAGFSKIKKYAESNNIPLIAVWSNGDACGHCTAFENSCMQSAFTKWMATSGCAFWFGCSSDTSKDDKINGTGYTWAWKNQSLKMYPFVRVYWKSGKVDTAKIGDDWTGGTSKGGATFVKNLKALLKKFDPNPANSTTEPTTDTTNDCNNGNCDVDSDCNNGNCNVNEKDYSNIITELESIKTEVAKISERITALENQVKAI